MSSCITDIFRKELFLETDEPFYRVTRGKPSKLSEKIGISETGEKSCINLSCIRGLQVTSASTR